MICKNLENKRNLDKCIDYMINDKGILIYRGIIYIPQKGEIKQIIMAEHHQNPYARHSSYQKMITSMKKELFWLGMKKEAMQYLTTCHECQLVKVDHQHLTGLLSPFPIHESKSEVISPYCFTILPQT